MRRAGFLRQVCHGAFLRHPAARNDVESTAEASPRHCQALLRSGNPALSSPRLGIFSESFRAALDCRAPLAMTWRELWKPHPVIAKRSCAAAMQIFLRHVSGSLQRFLPRGTELPRSARNDVERTVETSPP